MGPINFDSKNGCPEIDVKYISKKFGGSVQFDLGDVIHDSFGKVHVKSEFPRLVPNFERETVSAEDRETLKNNLMKWIVKHFDITGKEKQFEELATASTLFTIYVNPFTPLFSKQMEINIKIYFWLWHMDDEFEYAIKMNIPFESLKRGSEQLSDTLIGKYNNDQLQFTEIPNYPFFRPLFNSLLDIHKSAFNIIPEYQERVGPSRFFLQRYFEAQRWFAADNIDERYSEESFRLFRRIIAYFDGIAEIIALIQGVTLSKEIRRSLPFQRILEICNSFGGFVNDLIGMKKEFANGETDNLIVFKVLKKKIPLQVAVQQVAELMKTELSDYILIKNVVLREFEYDYNLVKYIDIIESLIDGHNRIYTESTRHRSAGCVKLIKNGD